MAGIFLLIISTTGSILVFHHDIDHAQFADQFTLETPASELVIDNSFEHIRQLHPGHDIRIPDFPKDSEQALKYELRKGKTRKWIFAHPETGEILTTVNRADQRLVHILLDLHYNLLSGTPGKIAVLLCGIALIVLSVTGFIIYRKSILKVISFRQKISFKSRRSLFSSLHRIVGVWGLVFNLLISITGTWIAITIVQSAFSSGSAATGSAAIDTPATTVSVDAVLRQVRRDYPAFEIKYLRFPINADGKLAVLGRLASDPAFYGFTSSKIQVDMRTGKIVTVNFLRDLPWYNRAVSVLKPLHFGDYAGLGVKLVYSFFGILPGVLAISGFFIWRFRQGSKSLPQKRMLSRPLAHSSSA